MSLLNFIKAALPAAAAARGGYLQGQDQEQDKQRATARQAMLDAASLGETEARTKLYTVQGDTKEASLSPWGTPFETDQGFMQYNKNTGEIRPAMPSSRNTTTPALSTTTPLVDKMKGAVAATVPIDPNAGGRGGDADAGANDASATLPPSPAASTTTPLLDAMKSAQSTTSSTSPLRKPKKYTHVPVTLNGTPAMVLQDDQGNLVDPTTHNPISGKIEPFVAPEKKAASEIPGTPEWKQAQTFKASIASPKLVQVQADDGSLSYVPASQAAGLKPPPKASAKVDAKAKMYSDMLNQSLPVMHDLIDKVNPSHLTAAMKMPVVGNMLLSQDEQTFMTNFRTALAGALHAESGARLSDAQLEFGYQRFLPLTNDSPKTKHEKLNNLQKLADDRTPAPSGSSGSKTAKSANPFDQFVPKPPDEEEQ